MTIAELALLLIRAVLRPIANLGNYERALLDVEEALSLTSTIKKVSLARIFYAEAQRLKGQCLFGLGRLHEAIIWMKHA